MVTVALASLLELWPTTEVGITTGIDCLHDHPPNFNGLKLFDHRTFKLEFFFMLDILWNYGFDIERIEKQVYTNKSMNSKRSNAACYLKHRNEKLRFYSNSEKDLFNGIKFNRDLDFIFSNDTKKKTQHLKRMEYDLNMKNSPAESFFLVFVFLRRFRKKKRKFNKNFYGEILI